MTEPKWQFKQLRPSDIKSNPIEQEFFNNDEAISAADSLIREAIQNSLDAGVKDRTSLGPVRVRIARGMCADPKLWFGGLAPHLTASEKLPPDWSPSSPSPFLVVEDFNTRGLLGDFNAGFESDFAEDQQQDFYYFWRNIGITSKRKGERGSWGLGKAVYPKSSRLHAFLGLSIAAGGQPTLMGQAVLPVHSIKSDTEATTFASHGYFGRFDYPSDGDFCLPLVEDPWLDEFRKAFGLKRTIEPGLSVVIPLPDEALLGANMGDQLVAAVIHHYAFPLLSGDLELVLEGFGDLRTVSRANVVGTVDSLAWEAIGGGLYSKERAQRLIQLGLEYVDKKTVFLEFTRGSSLSPKWDDLQLDEKKMAEAGAAFADGKAVTFRVPISLRTPEKINVDDFFEIALQKRLSSADSHVEFIRQGLAISEIGGSPGPGIVGIVHVNDGVLAECLRAAENPAHTKWTKNSERLKQWLGGQVRVDFVRNAPRQLAKKLAGEAATLDKTFLSEFFPVMAGLGPKMKGSGPPKPGTPVSKPPPMGPIPPARPRALALTQIDAGFSLRSTGQAKRPKSVTVEVAFDTISGNPFKAWAHWDFDLGDPKGGISIDVVGGSIIKAEGRFITFAIDSDNFAAKVAGFEPTRDLSIRWTSGKDDDASDDDSEKGDDEQDEEEVNT